MARDLSVTALYTSATWAWGELPGADLFDHPDARRVFRVVNAVLAASRPFIDVRSPLPIALLHRHTFIDVLLRSSGVRRVLELAAGLSRRGVAFSADPRIEYVEVDRPSVIDKKRALLERSEEGRLALARPNLCMTGADVLATSLEELCPSDGAPLFIVAEGLLMYLQPDAQRRLAQSVAARLAESGGTFVFDLVPPIELPPPGVVGRSLGWAMRRMTGGQGFARDERTRAQVSSDVTAAGFDRVQAIEPCEVAREWNLPHPDARTQQVVFVAQMEPRLERGRS